MTQNLKLKIRIIFAYILPFIIVVVYSMMIELIKMSFFPADKLLVKYLFDMFISITAPIVFLLTGFFVAPINKKGTVKILSIIICVMTIIAISATLDSPLQLSTYITIVVVTVITFVVLNKKKLKNE